MATIGRKRRTHKQKRIKINAVRIKKQRIAREPKTPKRFNAFSKNYEEAVASGRMDKSKSIEKEIETIKKYLNKDGTPNKRALRSKKAQKEFREAVKAFNKAHKKWGKKYFEDLGEKQALKKIKGSGTHAENEIHKAKQSGANGVDLTMLALKATELYYKMVDLFALDSFEKLREQLNIGSPVVERIANSALSTFDAEQYFKDFLDAYDHLPQEAIDLAKQDDLMKAIDDLSVLAGRENIKEVLETYMFANKNERDNVVQLAVFHAQHGSEKSFSTFYEQVQNSIDPNNQKTWGELV